MSTTGIMKSNTTRSMSSCKHQGSGWSLLLHIVAPVVVGGAIYVLWRSHSLLVFSWLRLARLTTTVAYLRSAAASVRRHLPIFVVSSLPDAIWTYAFTCAMRRIWVDQPFSLKSSIWQAIPLILSVGSEFGQLLHIVPGTFDWVDVAGCMLAGVLALRFGGLASPSGDKQCVATF